MKATLETTTPQQQLRMCDLQPGDVAEILSGEYIGQIISMSGIRTASLIGGSGKAWVTPSSELIPVRRLTPGEKIVIG